MSNFNVSLYERTLTSITREDLVEKAADVFTCRTLVSYAATLSRNKLIEMIHIKQQLWRTLAQKEAVEATVALQTEFTSVAAHEVG